jgi:hypothetical protein
LTRHHDDSLPEQPIAVVSAGRRPCNIQKRRTLSTPLRRQMPAPSLIDTHARAAPQRMQSHPAARPRAHATHIQPL